MYQPGEILLNKYRIEALAGQGAFAHVYRATHLSLNAPRALKVLRRDAPGVGSADYAEFQARFQQEAQIGAKLDHPHVIRVYDFGQDGDDADPGDGVRGRRQPGGTHGPGAGCRRLHPH